MMTRHNSHTTFIPRNNILAEKSQNCHRIVPISDRKTDRVTAFHADEGVSYGSAKTQRHIAFLMDGSHHLKKMIDLGQGQSK